MKKKLLSIALATIVAVMAISGASLAWLQDTTSTVTNTFTKGLVDIDLYETKDSQKVLANSYKMVPGDTLTKDPTVEVLAVSEACWLFVKVEKSENFATYLTYSIADGWTELTEGSGVYYRAVEDKGENQTFAVLKDNEVTVKEGVTVAQMNALDNNGLEMEFTAYAIQSANIADANNNGTAADEAWAIVGNTTNG